MNPESSAGQGQAMDHQTTNRRTVFQSSLFATRCGSAGHGRADDPRLLRTATCDRTETCVTRTCGRCTRTCARTRELESQRGGTKLPLGRKSWSVVSVWLCSAERSESRIHLLPDLSSGLFLFFKMIGLNETAGKRLRHSLPTT